MLDFQDWFHENPEYSNTETHQWDSKDVDIAYLSYCVDYLSDQIDELQGEYHDLIICKPSYS